MVFIVKPAFSHIGTGLLFTTATSVPNSFTIDPGAFLVSTNSSAVLLQGTGVWTVTINAKAAGTKSTS
jgi:hypothetical protein